MSNISILKMVVVGVIAALLMTLAGIIYLVASTDKSVPDILQIVVASCISGLLGLLAPSKDATNPHT